LLRGADKEVLNYEGTSALEMADEIQTEKL